MQNCPSMVSGNFFYRKSHTNNGETIAAIEANNDTYCLQKRIEKFPLIILPQKFHNFLSWMWIQLELFWQKEDAADWIFSFEIPIWLKIYSISPWVSSQCDTKMRLLFVLSNVIWWCHRCISVHINTCLLTHHEKRPLWPTYEVNNTF